MSESEKPKPAVREQPPELHAHVVDSDPTAVKMHALVLESLGLKVTIQNMNHNVLATIEKNVPDFLVTEVSVPGVDIFKIFDEIYRDRRFARTKFILCTKNEDVLHTRKHLLRKYNLDRVYNKPLNADKFKRDIKHLISLKYKQLGFKPTVE